MRLKNNRLTAALLLGPSHSGEFVNIIIISSLIHCIMFWVLTVDSNGLARHDKYSLSVGLAICVHVAWCLYCRHLWGCCFSASTELVYTDSVLMTSMKINFSFYLPLIPDKDFRLYALQWVRWHCLHLSVRGFVIIVPPTAMQTLSEMLLLRRSAVWHSKLQCIPGHAAGPPTEWPILN